MVVQSGVTFIVGRFESQRDTLMQQSFNMEQANIQVESLKSTIEQASLMKETKKSLQGQLKKFDATEVDVRRAPPICAIRRLMCV